MPSSSFAADWAKGRWNPTYWAERFLGIRLNPGQRRMVDAYLKRTKSGWRALYLWIMVAAGNRAGKTLGLTVIILHETVYKIGLEPPDIHDEDAVARWLRLPFNHWHFAIEQSPAEQVFAEIELLLDGNHPAQKDGCPWAAEVGGKAAICDTIQKERGEYAWVQFTPLFGKGQIHFRSTKQKALGSLGQNMNGVSFDEAGAEPNLAFLLNEVLHFRRLGTGGQFFLITTPMVSTGTDFEDLWVTGDPEDPFRQPRRFSMRMSSRENIGYGLEQETFDSMIEGVDEAIIRQNIEGEFVQAQTAWFNAPAVDAVFHEKLPLDVPPRPDRVYIHSLDPGLKDKCWSLVFEVTAPGFARGVHIERTVGKQTTRGIVAQGTRVHNTYGLDGAAQVETGVDTTGFGGHMFRELLEEFITIKSVEFGGVTKIKRQLLSDLKAAIDEGRLSMPAGGLWAEARRQLRGYKLLDRKIEQDLVMGLAIIVKLLRQAPAPGQVTTAAFDYLSVKSDEPRHDEIIQPDGSVRSDGINSKTLRSKLAAKRRLQKSLSQADGVV